MPGRARGLRPRSSPIEIALPSFPGSPIADRRIAGSVRGPFVLDSPGVASLEVRSSGAPVKRRARSDALIVSGMISREFRRVVGVWLTLFFLAVAGAPHQHVNGLEDLLLDEPSDSGTLFEIDNSSDVDERTSLTAVDVIQDHPCLACFNRDFVSAPVSTIAFRFLLAPAVASRSLPARSAGRTRPRSVSSRGPPALL